MKSRSIFLAGGLSLVMTSAAVADIQFEQADFNLGEYTNDSIMFFDKENDGDLDAITYGERQISSIYQKNTNGFTRESSSAELVRWGALTTDINNDGFQDIISYPFNISLNDGTGSFLTPNSWLPAISDQSDNHEIKTTDLDQNGQVDVVLSSWKMTGVNTFIYMNVSHSTTSPGEFSYDYEVNLNSLSFDGTQVNHKTRGVAIGDLNGDGYPDTVIINSPYILFGYLVLGGSTVMLNDGAGKLIPSAYISGAEDIELGDLDGDGDLDAYLAIGEDSPDEVWFNDGNGAFINSGQALGGNDSIDAAMADLDGDGDLDVVSASYNQALPSLQNQSHTVWLNDGFGQLTQSAFTFGSGHVTKTLELVDIDQDGDTDIVTMGGREHYQSGTFSNTSEIWLNQLVPNNSGSGSGNCGFYSQSDLDQAIADATQVGILEGIQMCQDNPNDYGLFGQADIDHSYSLGIQLCKEDPASCGLFNQADIDNALLIGLVQGKQRCTDDPASCGLFSQAELDSALASGMSLGVQSCINAPASCSLFGQADVDGAFSSGQLLGIDQGIQQCKDDPAICGLFDQQQIDNSVTQVVNQIISDLPKGQINSVCKKNPSSPLCQQLSTNLASIQA